MGFLHRLLAMVYKEALQLRRDRLTFAMMFGVPIMQLLLFGYAIDTDPHRLPTAVVVADQSQITRTILSALEDQGFPVSSVTTSRPSLDDVYLHFTGRDFSTEDAAG